MNRNIVDISSLVSLLPTAAHAATVNGASVEMHRHSGRAALVLESAAGTGTSPTLDVSLEDSDDGVSWAATGVAFAQVTTVASRQMLGVDVDSLRRHVRARAVIGGTGPSFTFAVIALVCPQVL